MSRVLPPRAKVWNNHTEVYEEDFKGEKIVIPAKSYIEMDWTDAVQFRGQYTPIVRSPMGQDLKPKMITVERIDAGPVAYSQFKCQMDGKNFDTQEALDSHIAEFHTEEMLDDDARRKFKAKR